jgi:hypothetical protein
MSKTTFGGREAIGQDVEHTDSYTTSIKALNRNGPGIQERMHNDRTCDLRLEMATFCYWKNRTLLTGTHISARYSFMTNQNSGFIV